MLRRPARDEPLILAPIGAKFESALAAGVHHSVMLCAGDPPYLRTARAENQHAPSVTAATLAVEVQERVLDCEETLLDSHWRLATRTMLLAATNELRRETTGAS